MELKSILNESVEEPIHFLSIAEKMPTEEVNEFDLFSSDKGNKARVSKLHTTWRGGSSRQ
ncbi:hypothetical protein J1N35_046117 [Gossypium stocksii]|uniref:Uncharacterized protein n=1 Tax=Gossypium stocksii TaxID=47602 RepID=A0A9D3ZE52_9ROSI|nr:hypothetical protein J1N35_046117 [Gossypium stocksii]